MIRGCVPKARPADRNVAILSRMLLGAANERTEFIVGQQLKRMSKQASHVWFRCWSRQGRKESERLLDVRNGNVRESNTLSRQGMQLFFSGNVVSVHEAQILFGNLPQVPVRPLRSWAPFEVLPSAARRAALHCASAASCGRKIM